MSKKRDKTKEQLNKFCESSNMQEILNKMKSLQNENSELSSKKSKLQSFNIKQTRNDPNGISNVRVKELENQIALLSR